MKRLLALLMAVILVICFVGCTNIDDNGGNSDTASDKYNLSDYMLKGQVPEAEFAIGTSVQSIKDKYDHDDSEESEDGHYHNDYYVIEGNRSDALQVGEVMYYYEKGSDTVSSIVCLVNGFGFEVSELTGKSDIIRAFPSFEYTEREVSNEELYFIPVGIEGCTAVTYSEGDFRLDFFFADNTLIGVNLVNTKIWTLT